MPSRYRALAIAGLVVGFFWLVPAQAEATELTSSDIVLIRENVVVDGDLYAAAMTVRVVGEVHGDLIAIAGERVIIDGQVFGSVTAIAGEVVVNGTVGGSVRTTANRVRVGGYIGGDLVAAAFVTQLGSSSTVDGELVVWGWRLSALGTIGNGITGSKRYIDLGGTIFGNVVVGTSRINLTFPTTIHGGLSYRSARQVEGLEQAVVTGTVTQRTPLPANIRIRALAIFTSILAIVFLSVAAVTTVWGWPARTEIATRQVTLKAWKNWLVGALVFGSPVMVVAAVATVVALAPPAASLPLMAMAVPLVLAMVGTLLVVALIAGVPVSGRVGMRLFKNVGIHGAVLGGSVILGLVWLLPVVGWLIPIAVLPWGLGSWLLSRQPRETPEADSSQASVSSS